MLGISGCIRGEATALRQIKSEIVLENLMLPVLFVDGTVRISGEFDMRQVLDAVEAAIEISD